MTRQATKAEASLEELAARHLADQFEEAEKSDCTGPRAISTAEMSCTAAPRREQAQLEEKASM